MFIRWSALANNTKNENRFMTIVEEEIERIVEEYRKRRRAIPPKEMRKILKDFADTVLQYH